MKLNIGSGAVKGTIFAGSDWLNVDSHWSPEDKGWPVGGRYINFDIREAWPLDDESAECIFASHVFEHIVYDKLMGTFAECYRVLKPGHPIRIVCPDPRAFIDAWRSGNYQFIRDSYDEPLIERWDYEHNPHIAFTDMFFSDHIDHWLISCPDLLTMFMIRAGFSVITEMKYASTEFPQHFGNWPVRQDSPRNTSLDTRPALSFYLEAIK